MGRNKGDPARSKGRPSSSSLAASLLQTPVGTSVGFGGYVGSARVDKGPSLDGDLLVELDGEASLHLKRLSKKDPNTKLKALAALTVIFKERPAGELSLLLPAWVFEYKKLVHDSSRQVRENTHVAMSALVTTVGRGIAPQLRSFMGPWWVAQFDPSGEVSDAAKSSFQMAFSGQKKRLEALIYCANEIFVHLDENLKLTPQTIGDKTTPIEESTEKLERIVSCTLLALAAIIDVFVGLMNSGPRAVSSVLDQIQTSQACTLVTEQATGLIWRHKYMREHIRSKSSRVRSAVYQTLRIYTQHLPQVFKDDEIESVATSVLGTFGEKDTACHQPMWDMVLMFSKRFPQAWGASSLRKVILPRLFGFLRHSCYGSELLSYPSFLPLLSLIPPESVAPGRTFLLDFFRNLWCGRPAFQLGPTYWLAFLTSVKECFLWAVKNARRFADAEAVDAQELQAALVDGVLLSMLWADYVGVPATQSVPVASIPDEEGFDLGQKRPSNSAERSYVEKESATANEAFTRDLTSTMIDSIITLCEAESTLLTTFWSELHRICLDLLKEAGLLWQSELKKEIRVLRIADFFELLGQKTLKSSNREEWVMGKAVRPLASKAFFLSQSMGDPESIRFLAKLTFLYGPTAMLGSSDCSSQDSRENNVKNDPLGNRVAVKFFREEIVPWCLRNSADDLAGEKAELILAFVRCPNLTDEWDYVISRITVTLEEVAELSLEQVQTLAVLLEKVREIENPNRGHTTGGNLLWWKSSKLDNAAIWVVSSKILSNPASFRFLRSVLGGTSIDEFESLDRAEKVRTSNVSSILMGGTAARIFQILLRRVLSLLSASDTSWVKQAPSLFNDSSEMSEELHPTEESLELAATSVDIVRDCLLCLPCLDRDSDVVGKLVASLFILRWGCPRLLDTPGCVEHEDSDLDSEQSSELEGISAGMDEIHGSSFVSSEISPDGGIDKLEQGWNLLRESVRTAMQKLSPSFAKTLRPLTRFRVREILASSLRNAISDEQFGSAQDMAMKGASWTTEIITFACEGTEEASELLDWVLAPTDYWPKWVIAPPSAHMNPENAVGFSHDSGVSLHDQDKRHMRFASFVDALCKEIGPLEVFFASTVARSTTERSDEASRVSLLDSSSLSSRTWIVMELLCTWRWPGGTASLSVLPLLSSLCRNDNTKHVSLVWSTIEALFLGASEAVSTRPSGHFESYTTYEDDKNSTQDPFLRALLRLMKVLLEMEDGWTSVDTRKLFSELVTTPDGVHYVSPVCDIRILPCVLSCLMPSLRKRSSGISELDDSAELEWETTLGKATTEWLRLAMNAAPLMISDANLNNAGVKWIRVAVSCFPLNPGGGVAAMVSATSTQISAEEKELLLQLLQNQFSRRAVADLAATAALTRSGYHPAGVDKMQMQVIESTLARLVAAAVAYCWPNFGVEEWEFVLRRLRGWLEEAVVDVEDFTETIAAIVEKEGDEVVAPNTIVTELENFVIEKAKVLVELSSTAVAVFSLVRGLEQLNTESVDALAVLHDASWKSVELRALEDVLRLLLAMGLAEAVASSKAGEEAGTVVALWRSQQSQLWDNVADVALTASSKAREAATRAVDLWGVGPGAVSALYALLFSTQPTMSSQWVAYNFLTSGNILEVAVTYGVVNSSEGESKTDEEDGDLSQEALAATVTNVRQELTSILGTTPSVILAEPLTSFLRVRYLLGWSLLLTRLSSLPSSSSSRERLVQYVQDADISATLLDMLFQHIPLESNIGGSGSRRKSSGTSAKVSSAASSATRAAATGSVAFAVEGLWPVQKESLMTLAAAVYGLTLLVLPACARIWFTGLRDKASATAIEGFTTTHCSPQLLSDEFAQVQASALRDHGASLDEEEFFVRANRSLREVTALYKKEEAGLDIVIRMPACYPLRAVGVECTRRIGIDETLLRKWILSMAAFLRNQNGAVSEAILMWKRNVDREFEGVEPCPICYSIIHTSNHSLPKLQCKTCKSKSHSACLYKWFTTSHQSTCPLCKTPF